MKSGATAVYRLFGADGGLLYVGMSSQPDIRWQQHAIEHPWWPEVADKSVQWFDRRTDAAREERRAILTEAPRYNVSRPREEDRHVMTLRLDAEMADDLSMISEITGKAANEIIRAALQSHLAAIRQTPAFKAACRRRLQNAERMLGEEPAA